MIKIINSSKDSVIKEFTKYQKNKRDDNIINSLFSHTNGKILEVIEISPKNDCETGKPFSKIINVEKKEQKLDFKIQLEKHLFVLEILFYLKLTKVNG